MDAVGRRNWSLWGVVGIGGEEVVILASRLHSSCDRGR